MLQRRFGRLTLTVALAALAAGRVGAGQGADETPPAMTASSLLPPTQIEGAHHEVAAKVRTEGFFHEVTITSAFGSFEAVGLSQVPVRIQEINALAALQDVSKTEVFLSAAGRSAVNVGKSTVSAVKDPEATAKGIGGGIKRFGVNLGRRTERAVESATDKEADPEDAEGGGNAAEGAAKTVLGVNSALRRWAQKVGVDPYTTNSVLHKALDSIAEVDAAGSIATKVVLPVPAVVGMSATVGDLVWGKDPEALRKLNEERLRGMQVPDDVAGRLFSNKAYTLTLQTRLIAAFHGLAIAGRDDYVKTASEAKRIREALFFVESAEMLRPLNQRERLTKLLTDSRALVASSSGGHVIALLPIDWLGATAATSKTLGEITSRAKKELAGTRLTMVLTGQASPRMAKELSASGWTVAKPPAGVNK
jgi:hypothetical protein